MCGAEACEMTASGAYEDHSVVGRRIGLARRELGLTQAAFSTRIGVPIGTLDRYESGKADPSDKLVRIAEVTGRRVSWFASNAPSDDDEAAHSAEVGKRIAESRGRLGLTRRELAEAVGVPLGKIERYESGLESPTIRLERIATALDEPRSWLEHGDTTGHENEHSGGERASEGRRPKRQDEHLALAGNHGYRLVTRPGAVPEPGEIIELEDGHYRCLRIGASPIPGDDRACAVLESVTAASES